MFKIKYLFLLSILFLFACKKEQEFHQAEEKKVVSLRVKGAVVSQDTLQFALNGRILASKAAGSFDIGQILLSANDQIQILKKADGKVLGIINVATSPFNQERKIFYDGTNLSDNIVITPVTNPQNMGVRLNFSTSFADFYGGPVDIEIFHRTIDLNTFEFTYQSVIKAKNVMRSFGDFFELQPLPESNDVELHGYVFKVYKSGTQELPYTSMDNVQLSDPENNYGDISFNAGTSQLIIISPYISDNKYIADGYAAGDIAGLFE